MYVRDGKKTTDNLAKRGAFTVSLATEDQVIPCDYVGMESGRKVPDKFDYYLKVFFICSRNFSAIGVKV